MVEGPSTFARSLQTTGAPKLTKEQLAKRRSEVIRYYNELSRSKNNRPKTAPPPPPPSLSTRPSRSVTPSRIQKPKSKTNGRMPVVPENADAEAWEQIKELTEKLLQVCPVPGIPRGEVEDHVGNVWKLVGK